MDLTERNRAFYRIPLIVGVLVLILGTLILEGLPPTALAALLDRFQVFVTILLGIFTEAVPFLVAGSVVSGIIQVWVSPQTLARFIPRQPVLATLMGAALGLVFPICECGVVPVTRRLQQKGLPLSAGIAFLLAAPVINPIVIASTYSAFGWGPILLGRIGFTLLIACAIGLVFQWADPREVILPEPVMPQVEPHVHADEPPTRWDERIAQTLAAAGDDFLDMARYLIAGSMLAALMQTLVPQSALLAIGQGPVTSVVALLLLAFVLSVCSTVDAFLALTFVNTFTSGAILGFLVFGPMVDIKSSLMFLRVFRRKTVLYLILLPLMMTLLMAVYVNLNVGW
jgi:uncharacterized membrane protein YraQ (UPF0718 family)